MSKKFISLLSFVMMLVFVSNAPAALVDWTGEGDSTLWSDPNNWSSAVPVSGDTAYIDINDANCLIDANVAAECYELYVGNESEEMPCRLYMTGGSLTIDTIYLGRQADANGIFTLTDGTVTANYRVKVGDSGNGTLIMSGGTMSCYDKYEVAKNDDANGVIYMMGGTMTLSGNSCDFEVGTYGKGYIYMTGGVIDVQDNIKLAPGSGSNSNGVVRFYLDGGTITASSLRNAADIYGDPRVDITGGTLILTGDDRATVTDYETNGWIVAYDGLGAVVVVYDDVNDETIVTGATRDANFAWSPTPSNFASLAWTADGVELSWKPGDNAVSHDVYVGTDWDDVNDANRASHPGLLYYSEGQDPCEYGPIPLHIDTTYYWRVDEVNGTTIWKGKVWRYSVVNLIVVDDIEYYGSNPTPNVEGGRIWYWWDQGVKFTTPYTYNGNGTGSGLGHWPPPVCEETNTHGGAKAMPYYYNNSGSTSKAYYSEASAKTIAGPNSLRITEKWDSEGGKSLSIWFYGDPGNDAATTEQMWVGLSDSDDNFKDLPYNGSMSDIQQAEWQEWNIDLSDFTGVDLDDVQRIYIGFGDRDTHPVPGGDGLVLFDDIRLYPPRCMPAIMQPGLDLDNDCDVDYEDLDIIVGDWLMDDYTGVGDDGVLKNFPNDNTQWVLDGTRGQCLLFDGTDDWVDLEDDQFSNFHNKTIALWINMQTYAASGSPYIFCFRDYDDDPAPYRVYIREHEDPNIRVQFVGSDANDYSADFTANTGGWHHIAFVLRDTGSDTCTGEFYGDGVLVDSMPDRPRHSGRARSIDIGTWNEGGTACINAKVDDFRIYDGALSLNGIKYLANVGGVAPTEPMLVHFKFDETTGYTASNSSTYVFNRPLISDAELYDGEAEGSRKINFRDIAVLAASEDWLEDPMLWPEE